jgi:hypothetical protein
MSDYDTDGEGGAQVCVCACYSGVTVALQWCYSGVTVVKQWCCSGVRAVMLRPCRSSVTLWSLCCYTVNTLLLRTCRSMIQMKGAAHMYALQWSYIGVTPLLQSS